MLSLRLCIRAIAAMDTHGWRQASIIWVLNSGLLEEALRVKSGLPGDLPIIQSDKLRHDIHARLLLGKDMPPRISEGKKTKPN